MTEKSNSLLWSLAFLVAILALTKEAATKEIGTSDEPYSFLIQHPSNSGI